MPTVLVADDELPMRRILDRLLRARGLETELVESGEAAIDAARTRRPDLLLLDLQMPGIGGMETLERMGRDMPSVPVVIMTATGSIETAVGAFKRGAIDFVTKPFDEVKLFAAVDAAISTRTSMELKPGPVMVGESPRFREAMDLALRFARPDINILLQGETGTGKELFARSIHAASKRKSGPFVPVDCSILSESLIESELFGHEKGAFTGATATRIGHFERADHGTLFLDEIGNLPPPTQAKLLRVLQERTMERVGGRETIKLDIRVVSATNVNLKDAIQRGTFRMDLYYRLSEMTIATPPLRERAGDVRRLAEHFVERYSAQFERNVHGITRAAVARLEAYAWPGNVRELENTIKAAVILADDEVRPEHLPEGLGDDGAAPPSPSVQQRTPPASMPPATMPSPSTSGERFRMEIEFGTGVEDLDLKALANVATEKAERAVLETVLKQGRYSHAQLAKLMNVDPKTLRAKLRKYGLES
jgi:DNA-binding NtrC family response regulator